MNQPNILFVACDDLDERSLSLVPGIRALFDAEFPNAFAPTPVCCPSRATWPTGMHAHNHRVLVNAAPRGGIEKYREMGHEDRNIASVLRAAGYRTVHVGKYLNGYSGARKPPHYDRFYGYVGNYRDDRLAFFENTEIVHYDPDKHLDTYVMRNHLVSELERRSTFPLEQRHPLFATLHFNAPHGPSLYDEERDGAAFSGEIAPRVPSFGEDLLDKPAWVRGGGGLSATEEAESDASYPRRLRSMLAVERSIRAIFEKLSEIGELDNTYVVFTSDNGYRFGEHGLVVGKGTPYEEDLGVPLFIRGPGISPDVYPQMALGTDLAPTFAEWAGVTHPSGAPLPWADGRSLVPVLRGENPLWRERFLVEGWTIENNA